MIFTPSFIAANNTLKGVNDVIFLKNYVTQFRSIWMTFDQGKKNLNRDMISNEKN